MSKKKVLYIVSNVDKALAFEWIADKLNKNTVEISFLLLNPGLSSYLQKYLTKKGIACTSIEFTGKKDFFKAFATILKYLIKHRPHVVHCHLFEASLLGLSAAFLVRVKKRVYTRHHSSYHHMYFPKMVYWDKLINFFATDIIAISNKVKQIIVEWEGSKTKVHVIPHGFDLNEFSHVGNERINSLIEKYKIEGSEFPIVGVIARQTEWKGIQYIIPAFKELLTHYPNAKLILANANGDYKETIGRHLSEIPSANYIEISFEYDIAALYRLFTIFVHTPIDNHSEAFGQTYVEALASKVPSVFTLSGIANDFIVDKQNALIVNYKNSQAIAEAIETLIKSKELQKKIVEGGFKSVNELFGLDKMISSLENIYLN